MKASFFSKLPAFLLFLFCVVTYQELLAQNPPPPPPPPGTGGGSTGIIIDGVLGKRDSTFLNLPDCEEVIQDSFLVIRHTYKLEVDTSNLSYLDMTLSLTDPQYNGLLGNFLGQQDSVFNGFFNFYQDTATVPYHIQCDSSGCFLYFTLYFSSNFPPPPADTAIYVSLLLEAKGQLASFFEIYVPICPETREFEVYESLNGGPKITGRQGRWQEDLRISPNPFSSQLSITTQSKEAAGVCYRLFDSQGRLWRETKTPSEAGSIRWQTESLAPGLYFLQVRTTSGSLGYYKLLKTR